MAVKTVKIKGGALIDTDSEYSGFVADDTSGLHFISDPDNTGNQKAISKITHRVTESNNPLWNQVNYTVTKNLGYATSGLSGHVTLIGIDQMGIEKDIMQHRFGSTVGVSTDYTYTFDLLQSACTSAVTKQVAGVGAAGEIKVDIPKRYDKFESVTLKPVWYDSAWTKRQAMQITKSEGNLHGVQGHISEYYGVNVGIIYDADMNDDLSDLRFVAPDGITICPHYFIRNITTKVAGAVCGAAVVMIPWQFVDYESEMIPSQTIITEYVNTYPSYLYMYYGNANATTTSDPTLGGNGFLYDEMNGVALDPKWTLHQSDAARNTIAYASTGITMGATAGGAAGPADVSITAPIGVNTQDGQSWECIIKLVNMTAMTINQVPIFRFQGHDDPNSYIDIRTAYTTPYDMGNGATTAYVWGMPFADSGVSTSAYYRPAPAITSSKPIYFKFRMNIADTNKAQTYNVMSGFMSGNGYDWDYLGKVKYMGTVWDVADDLDLKIYYYVATGVTPVAGNIKVEKVISYPIMGGKGSIFEDHFQDIYGTSTSLPFLNRWQTQYNNTYRTLTQDNGYMTLATNGTTVDTAHTIALENGYMDPLCMNTPATAAYDTYATGDRMFYGTSVYEDIVYETEIRSISNPTTASDFNEAGIFYYPGGSYTGNYGWMFGARYTNGGTYRFYKTTWSSSGGGTVSSGSTGISWADADMPIKLRVRFNHRTQKLVGEYRKMGSGGEWLTAFIDSGGMTNTNYLGSAIGVAGIYIRGAQTKAEVRTITFNNFITYSGNRILADNGDTWKAEETYSAGVAPTTPVDEDMQLTFDSAGLGQRNEPYQIVTKDYGGDYSYSKIFNLRDQDYIQVGPDGVDKYIGMKLEFNFDFESTDVFEVSEINYVYEVI